MMDFYSLQAVFEQRIIFFIQSFLPGLINVSISSTFLDALAIGRQSEIIYILKMWL